MTKIGSPTLEELFDVIPRLYSAAVADISDAPQPKGSPKRVEKKKEGSDLLKLPFGPRKNKPAGFWNATWCHYEVAVGQHVSFPADKGRPFLWHVGFLYAPGNIKCAHGRFESQAVEILLRAEAKRPSDFFVVKRGDARPRGDQRAGGWPFLHIFRRYYLGDFSTVTGKIVAEDLAWLVKETYPRFTSMH